MTGAHTRRVGIIGSGVAGLTAAYVISKSADVTVFEADDRLGGHADTHQVPLPDGTTVAIDTGFIVHNERTYPTLLRIFRELGVTTQPSDMSMSVRSDAAHGGAGLEWAGAKGRKGIFPSSRNLRRPAYLRMLVEITRFHRRARALLASVSATDDGQTLAEFLDAGRFSPYFRRHFMAPVVAAVWSCDEDLALRYPARYLFEFLNHHGMLSIYGSPQWRTVTGGSHQYVEKVAAAVTGRNGTILLDTKVTSVQDTGNGVEVTDGNGTRHHFDAVVIATHPGQALAMLAEPTPLQSDVLGAMPYSQNLAQLHTDTSLLPRHPNAWASWNQLERLDRERVTVTYDLTRLMNLPSPDGIRHLVTLGAPELVDPAKVIATRHYEHPMYTPESVAAQRRLSEIDTDRIVFAGAYHGWGFHEDGSRSGAAAATRLGFAWPEEPSTRSAANLTTPRVYQSTVTHTRRTPLKHRFSNRTHLWLVDLDNLPDHGLLGRFEARDHLGDPDRTIRANVEAFLAREGVVVTGGRILMAANARAFGYCFNPISVFWCYDNTGSLAATVVEVHNTYGDRHAYLVHPDARGHALVGKQMYVSPFHGTDGHYELTVPEPGEKLTIAVRLITEAGEVFDAALRGDVLHGRPRATVLRAAPAALLGALRIRFHGVWLWVRRLPVQPRPHHHQEGVR